LIAKLMYYVKDIESFGTGLKRITDACDVAGVKVKFEMSKLGFAVIFYRPDISISDGNITNGITENITINVTNSITVNDMQKAIISQMQKNPKVTTKMLAEILGIADRNVKNHIKTLKQSRLIEREGSAKGGYWVVNYQK